MKLPHARVPQKTTKTGHARVLTSSEAWAILREKEQKKQQDAVEKEKRKLEREEKRKQKEEEKKQKDEQREAKRKEREEAKARKELERLQRQENRAKKEAMKRQISQVTEEDHSRASEESGRLRKRPKQSTARNVIKENQCCVCGGLFEEDEGTGRIWLKCTCNRWIHEDCIIPCSNSSKLCPIC